jgi:hypothetical protein
MAVLWRPMAQALPWDRPDGWAFTVGSPEFWIAESVEGAPVYVLADHECLWSAWLDMSLACERTEPWFTRLLQEHRPGDSTLRRRQHRLVRQPGARLRALPAAADRPSRCAR